MLKFSWLWKQLLTDDSKEEIIFNTVSKSNFLHRFDRGSNFLSYSVSEEKKFKLAN